MNVRGAGLAALLALCAGCTLVGTGGTTEMQVTDSAAFAHARTYRIVPSTDPIPGIDDATSAQVRAAIESALGAELDRKGYRRVDGATAGSADLRVQYRAASVSRVERDAQPAPKLAQLTTVGGDSAATGYEPLAGAAKSSAFGRLVVYINDDRSGQVVWQGTTEGESVGKFMVREQAGRAAARLVRDAPRSAVPQ